MPFNDGLERKKFKTWQTKQKAEYRAAGMSDNAIKKMYEFDLEQYKNSRRFYTHNQPLEPLKYNANEDDIEKTPLFQKYGDVFTASDEQSNEHSRFWWVEEIDDPLLVRKLRQLSINDMELLTLQIFDGYKQSEIAEMYATSKQNINNKIGRIKTFFK